MLPFKRLISIDRGLDLPVYQQICNGIIRMITEGLLLQDSILPSTRTLAKMLEVNRNTINIAYDELISQGWVNAMERRGYFVQENVPVISKQTMLASNKAGQMENFEWNNRFDGLNVSRVPQKLSLAIDEGIPDVRLAPVRELFRECKSIHDHFYGKSLLKYGNPKGSEKLRSCIGSYLLRNRGVKVEPEDVIITKGSQMGIYIASQLLIEAGDVVAVGNPNYQLANSTFISAGAKLLHVPVDGLGMDIDYLEEVLSHTKIKAVFVIPNHHCPTTVTMSSERRVKLLRLAREHRFAIVEDDYDFDFQYEESPYLPLVGCEGSENVVYIGSLSKTFAPAIRVGFMIGPKRFINAAASLRNIMERQGDTLIEEAFASLFESGEMERHFRKSIKIYKERRDVFCDMLNVNFNEYVDFNVPDGGLAVWSQFDTNVNLVKTAENALQRGLYVPDGKLYKNESFLDNSLRMGFASLDEMEMERAMGILKRSIA